MKESAIKALLAISAIFAPIQSMLATVLALIAVDLITGIWAAHKQKIKLTSAGFGRTITKSVVYLSSVCLGYLVQHYLMNDLIPVTNIISSYIGFTELISCLENINKIGGNNLLSTIIKKLSSENDNKQPK